MAVHEIRAWLSTLDPADFVGIDDGGLSLVAVVAVDAEPRAPYLEVGGLPADDCSCLGCPGCSTEDGCGRGPEEDGDGLCATCADRGPK